MEVIQGQINEWDELGGNSGKEMGRKGYTAEEERDK